MNARLAHDMEETRSHFKAMIEKAFYEIESRVVSVVNTVTSVLGRNIQNASVEVKKLQYTFQDLVDEVLSANEQITIAHQQNAISHNELALSLRSKLESVLQDDMARLLHNIDAFDSSLEWLSGRFGLLSEREMSISEVSGSLKLNRMLRAESLHKAQLQQSEAIEFQSRLQEKLQTSVQISQALIDKAAATAANLQAMIDETSARYTYTPALRPLFSSYFSWTFFGLLLSLIASHNVKVALAMLIIGARKYQYPQLILGQFPGTIAPCAPATRCKRRSWWHGLDLCIT
ncbi:hypothetical protein P875_00064994 [Aspergillus parasiticus SU-1]|uniref:Uncharacterized protein n=1 Tax=Aspergillus parasiticus (strain ATCC 56775 / NRRL 5862 / SRRC 143 / SU-1) TaxID=1403190 RepID=A0A0F0ICB7_ASPPU|nr:hypothetical protein P875_00064994 [Aspergillus parasiticus SU-1]